MNDEKEATIGAAKMFAISGKRGKKIIANQSSRVSARKLPCVEYRLDDGRIAYLIGEKNGVCVIEPAG